MVPLLSSAARMPLPGATSAAAVTGSSSMVMVEPPWVAAPRSLMRFGGLVGGGAGMAKSAQDRRVYTPSTHGAVCDRRPGHSSYRTVRGVDRPDHPRPIAWPAPWPLSLIHISE